MAIETSGTGTASMPCQLVALGVTLRRRDRSSRVARQRAKELLEKLHAKLTSLSSAGVRFDSDGMTARFSIDSRHATRDGSATVVDYEAVYRLTLKTIDHARFVEIFDAVTELEGVEADSPRFLVDDGHEQQLRNDAFRAAVANAKAKFDFQCRTIGLDPQRYEVVSWSYHGGHESSSPKRLVIEEDAATTSGGAVTVSLTVRLSHEPKKV